MESEIDAIRQALGLEPHPTEGGYLRVTFTSPIAVDAAALGPPASGDRAAGSAVYYLVTREDFSALHRLRGPEIFHFYLGDALEMLQLHPDGAATRHRLGTDLAAGQRPQVLVPAGVWQGTRLLEGGRYALLGTTMCPGFDWRDFELGRREELVQRYPAERAAILALTRQEG
ncbi:MAG: cupin domain-containing protein [Candidatus Eiseniibacteriota bacterium]